MKKVSFLRVRGREWITEGIIKISPPNCSTPFWEIQYADGKKYCIAEDICVGYEQGGEEEDEMQTYSFDGQGYYRLDDKGGWCKLSDNEQAMKEKDEQISTLNAKLVSAGNMNKGLAEQITGLAEQITSLQMYKDATLGKESERERQITALTAELKTPCYCCRESGCQDGCRCQDALKQVER